MVEHAIHSKILLLLEGTVSQDFLISEQNSAYYPCVKLSQPEKSKIKFTVFPNIFGALVIK